jgi:hypothetical protein
LSVPSIFQATQGQFNTGIRLLWSNSADASYYDLYRSTSPDFSSATLRAHIRIRNFNDRQTLTGINYYYWIYARAVGRTSPQDGPIIGIRGLAPRFVVEPKKDNIGVLGSNLTITAVANGYPAVSYQWYKGPVLITDTGNISGSQTNTLSFTPLKIKDSGDVYYLRIKNTTGAVNSIRVRVEVQQP